VVTFWKRFSIPIVVTLVALGAFALYAVTMAPSLSLAHGGTDGAELAVAVRTVGIPHPSGYPTYLLLAQPFRALPWGTLAGRLNLFSACAAAATVGIIALAAANLFAGQIQRRDAEVPEGLPRNISSGQSSPESPLRSRGKQPLGEDRGLAELSAALTAGCSLALAGSFWSQALRAEVYTLHTLFFALGLLFLLRWRTHRGASLPLAGLFLGLGMGNHLSLLFLLAGAVLFLLLSRPRPCLRELLLAGGLFLAGLAVYLYLPIRAAADPFLNWGDPRNWANFWAHVSGQAYRGLLFRVPASQAAGRFSAAARALLGDFAPWGALLGLAGAVLQAREDRPALSLTALPAGLGLLLALTYGGVNSQVHLLPLTVSWALWAGLAAGTVAAALSRRLGGRIARTALLIPLLSLALLPWRWPQMTLRADPGPLPAQAQLLAELPPDALVLTNSDEQTFPLWYAQMVERARPDVAVVDVRLLGWPWYRPQLPSRYPGLAVPATAAGEGWLQALLEANAGRPAFTLGPVPLPAGYRLRNEGAAFRVMAP